MDVRRTYRILCGLTIVRDFWMSNVEIKENIVQDMYETEREDSLMG